MLEDKAQGKTEYENTSYQTASPAQIDNNVIWKITSIRKKVIIWSEAGFISSPGAERT